MLHRGKTCSDVTSEKTTARLLHRGNHGEVTSGGHGEVTSGGDHSEVTSDKNTAISKPADMSHKTKPRRDVT